MKIRIGTVLKWSAGLILCSVGIAAAPMGPQTVQVGEEVRLELPANWTLLEKVDEDPRHRSPELRLAARSDDGRHVGSLAVSSAPNATKDAVDKALPGQVENTPLDEIETNAILLALTGEGYRVATVENSWLSRPDGPVVTSLIRCHPREGEQRIIETAAWIRSDRILRVQLRYDLAFADSAEIQALKASLRFGKGSNPILNTAYPASDPQAGRLAASAPLPPAPMLGSESATDVLVPTSAPLSTPAPVSAEADTRSAELLTQYTDSLAIVQGNEGAGSSFICKLNGHTFLVTNAHVLRGNESARFTLVDQSPITVGKAAAAVGHDVMAFTVDDALHGIEVMEKVDQEVRIGDKVVVLGNAEGASVVNLKEGKIVGIGPNLVEVDAPFVPGNSGSPIIHKDTGKVIGVATYLVTREVGGRNGGVEEKVRRFGYRLDSVKQWQPVTWPAFFAQDRSLRDVESLTEDLLGLLRDIGDDGVLKRGAHQNAAIRGPVKSFIETAIRRDASEDDFRKAVRNMVSFVRIACRTDVQRVRPTLTYDYLQRTLDDEARVRARIDDTFSRILNAQ